MSDPDSRSTSNMPKYMKNSTYCQSASVAEMNFGF